MAGDKPKLDDVIGALAMCCPVCNQAIKEPVKGYHAKPIPWEMMRAGDRPQCEMPRCKGMAKWNVNNGHAICEKHFVALASQGIPVFIIAKALKQT